MKIIVSNIDWDYPGKPEGKPCPDHLPRQVVIDNPIRVAVLAENMKKESSTADYLIAEYLTDEYECAVCGFVPELEGDMEK